MVIITSKWTCFCSFCDIFLSVKFAKKCNDISKFCCNGNLIPCFMLSHTTEKTFYTISTFPAHPFVALTDIKLIPLSALLISIYEEIRNISCLIHHFIFWIIFQETCLFGWKWQICVIGWLKLSTISICGTRRVIYRFVPVFRMHMTP